MNKKELKEIITRRINKLSKENPHLNYELDYYKIFLPEYASSENKRIIAYMLSLQEGDTIEYEDGIKAFIQKIGFPDSRINTYYDEFRR
jgi:hypothetical protein